MVDVEWANNYLSIPALPTWEVCQALHAGKLKSLIHTHLADNLMFCSLGVMYSAFLNLPASIRASFEAKAITAEPPSEIETLIIEQSIKMTGSFQSAYAAEMEATLHAFFLSLLMRPFFVFYSRVAKAETMRVYL